MFIASNKARCLTCRYNNGKPPIFWLSGFFFVQSFLTAGLQNFARSQKIPIDVVAYDFEMLSDDPALHNEAPPEGVYVHGLFLEGCGWDKEAQQLQESEPKVLFAHAPCMWLRPYETSLIPSRPHYACPLYRTAERKGVLATTGHSTNFVMFVKLPTEEPQSHWVMRGVALLSQLSD
jgi:dynein heavy chain, axonemal